MNVIGAGKSLLLAEPPLYKPHLWFVLTDPEGNPEKVVAVMVRTATRFTDSTVVLRSGDHPFVKHDSSVHYSTAQYLSISGLTKAIKSGRCHPKADMSQQLLDRVRHGLLESPFTVNAIRDYCRSRFPVG